jgi:hypothetical protein
MKRAEGTGGGVVGRPGPNLSNAGFAILVGALYVAAVLLPFRVFLPRFSTHLIGDHPDTLLQHLHCAWQWLALAEGRFGELLRLPTMAPYGSGLAFGEPLVGATLPFALVYALTGSTPAAFNAAVVASFLLLGVATFLWVRDLFESRAAGLLAAVLVVFNPWRVHFLTALNLLTIHYAVFGLWLLGRWLRRPSLVSLLGAALCLHLQLVTAAQGAIVGSGLALVWVAVVWIRSGLELRALRVAHGILALVLFVGLALPWAAFFREAFESASGLPRTGQMQRFSLPFAQMARLFGVFGPLGILALVAVPMLCLAIRAQRLRAGVGADLLGLALGAAALFVVARGPYVGAAADPTPLPGYYAAGVLPWLDLFRAPIRLAAFTPLVLAVLAGGAMASFERFVRNRGPRHAAALCALLPLGLALLWPPLPGEMAAPIGARPEDRDLATALAALPGDAVIVSLPLDLEPSGAAVDERVLIHRRSQVGGFASIMPPLFPQLGNLLGQWPFDAQGVAQLLGATHLVVPDAWLRRGADAARREGVQRVASVAGRSVVALPPRASRPPSWRLHSPEAAATGRWLTLSLYQTEPSVHLRGHEDLAAVWRSGARTLRVDARALLPGIVGPRDPIRIHVPTPDAPGRYELGVALPALPIEATIDVREADTSADEPIRAASIELAAGYRAPDAVRAAGSFRVAVRIEAGPGPILLASSLERLPDRRGETLVVYRFRPRAAAPASAATAQPGLSGDLLPGEAIEQTWYLAAPPHPGRYDLVVALAARGDPGSLSMPWIELLSDLRVVPD